MKKTILLALMIASFTSFAQSPPPLKERSSAQFTQVDKFLAAPLGFKFPSGSTNTLYGAGNLASLFWNSTENKLYVHNGTSWLVAGGGGGAVKLKSANADIALSLMGDTTVFELNSGLGANKIVKRDASGAILIGSSNVKIGGFGANDIYYNALSHQMYQTSGGTITGHYFSASSTDFTFFPQSSFPGRLIIYPLRTTSTSPAQSGNIRMVTTDGSGILGFQSIPSGGGTIGYNSGDYVGRQGAGAGILFNSSADTRILTNSNKDLIISANESFSSATGGVVFKTHNLDRAIIDVDGNFYVDILKTTGTAPTTSGTLNMLTVDGNGKFSRQAIPSGGGGTWGSITGALSSQTDLQTALNSKQATLSGTGFLKVTGSTISYDNTTYLPLSGGTLTGALSGTNATFSGSVTASSGFFDSDIRLKKIVYQKFDASKITAITYKWRNGPDDRTHVGYSAQQVKRHMPDAVNKDEKGKLSVNYIEVLVQKVAQLEKRIKELEAKK